MLRARVLTALALVAALLAALFLLPAAGWLALAALLCAGGAWEWGGLMAFSTQQRGAFALLMGAACLLIGAMSGSAQASASASAAAGGLGALYALAALFWLVAAPVWLARKWRIRGAGAAVAVGIVVLLPPALAFAHLRLISPWLLLAAMALVWMADIAAYFTGRAFGRRKLAPTISPGKTWEGAAGAVLGVMIYGIAVYFSVPHGLSQAPIWAVPLLFAALTALSVEGDLFESLLKRQAGIKDSGTLLPGHGGILDRIDSLTSTLPLVGLLSLWLAN